MKALTLSIMFLHCLTGSFSIDLEQIRSNYLLAPTIKNLCRDMILKLDQTKDPLHMAYLGAFKAIWA